ncbi:MAG: metal ABC transporter substrate-binding protein [Candidatus Deferrimicrobiaceae bacterium]
MNLLAALLATVLVLSPLPPVAQGADLRVLASFLPMSLFARNVVGDAPGVTVEMMLPASLGCPHDYSLSPGDMRKIAESDVLIANGFGMEAFLGAPVRRANPKIVVVETASSVAPLRAGGDHGDVNPHTWVSPRNAILQVRAIEKALSDLSPENAPVFRRNADAYAGRLEALAREFDENAGRFRNRKIVTFHNVFDYLARDIGLTIVGWIEETPGQEPSAGEMRALIRTIRETKAAAVFAEPQYPEKLAATIAREAGVPVRLLDPVSTGSTAMTAYEDIMRRNLRTLAEALGTR